MKVNGKDTRLLHRNEMRGRRHRHVPLNTMTIESALLLSPQIKSNLKGKKMLKKAKQQEAFKAIPKL
jgi:hypothetical protein